MLSSRTLGIIMIAVGLVISYHNYVAHIANNQFIIELWIGSVTLYVLGIALIMKILRVKS